MHLKNKKFSKRDILRKINELYEFPDPYDDMILSYRDKMLYEAVKLSNSSPLYFRHFPLQDLIGVALMAYVNGYYVQITGSWASYLRKSMRQESVSFIDPLDNKMYDIFHSNPDLEALQHNTQTIEAIITDPKIIEIFTLPGNFLYKTVKSIAEFESEYIVIQHEDDTDIVWHLYKLRDEDVNKFFSKKRWGYLKF